jgi:cytochrome c
VWCGDAEKPARVLEGHEAPVTALTEVGGKLYSASFDASVRAWDTQTGAALGKVVEHVAAISAVSRQGSQLAWGSADGAMGIGSQGMEGRRTGLPAPVTALAAAGDEIVAAGSDGTLRITGPDGASASIEVEQIPLASLAVSPDGGLIATAGLRGGIAIVDRRERRVLHRLTGPGLPVWSLAFDNDSRTLFSGGADRVIRRWDAVAGRAISSGLPERDPVAEAVATGERGAVVFRACQACHTLGPDDGNRAGPTLHGVFGRRIGTAQGYAYSEALPRMEIVWSRETIAKLFEVGPSAYTPGTKMPEQTINDPADRRALVEWLERVTAAR